MGSYNLKKRRTSASLSNWGSFGNSESGETTSRNIIHGFRFFDRSETCLRRSRSKSIGEGRRECKQNDQGLICSTVYFWRQIVGKSILELIYTLYVVCKVKTLGNYLTNTKHTHQFLVSIQIKNGKYVTLCKSVEEIQIALRSLTLIVFIFGSFHSKLFRSHTVKCFNSQLKTQNCVLSRKFRQFDKAVLW